MLGRRSRSPRRVRDREDKPVIGQLAVVRATDIASPPQTAEGSSSTSRLTLETNRTWLQARGVGVHENVDVFNLLLYLQGEGIAAEDVSLCVFSGAHGRNYHEDATSRFERMQAWRWNPTAFRGAAFAAMCGQLQNATVILTSRDWETCWPRMLSHRPILFSRATYAPQAGPAYQPEPSTRGDRRPGEVADTNGLVATVAVGPLFEKYLHRRSEAPTEDATTSVLTVDVPELTHLACTMPGVILFIGEFTCSHARHCMNFALEQMALRPAEAAEGRFWHWQLPREIRWHWQREEWCSYEHSLVVGPADALDTARWWYNTCL